MDQSSVTQDDKVYAALSYLWILSILPLVMKRDRPFVQFHARQGFMLFIAESVVSLVTVLPVLGWIVGFFGWICAVVLTIMGLWAALSGREWEMPFLGAYTRKFRL